MVDARLKLQLKSRFINISEDTASSKIMRERIDRYSIYYYFLVHKYIYLKNRVSRLLANRERFSPL